jgi:hypothetical protein
MRSLSPFYCIASSPFSAIFGLAHFRSTSLPVVTLFTDEARSALISKADGRLTLANFFQYPLEILLKV